VQAPGANKLKTALDIRRRIENWPTAFAMRLRRNQRGLRLLRFRDGLNVVCRAGTWDWDVVHELLFAGSYGRALECLKTLSGEPVVLDLGGNIGLFSLLAAAARPSAHIHAYEPGPPNLRIFQMNLLANPALASRIHLHQAAVGGHARDTEWSFDEENPGASGLFGPASGAAHPKFRVTVQSFADVLAALRAPVDLAKIDIEGSEFELLAETPPESWRQVRNISLELHEDPARRMSQDDFLRRCESLGYRIQTEAGVTCGATRLNSYFLQR